MDVQVPKRDNEPKRVAKCSVKFAKVDVLPPRSYKGKKMSGVLPVHVIQVVEDKPPKGSSKIEWVLYTNIPIICYSDAIEKIQWYCLRWRIEDYFKVIKSGFHVEKCRLETAERLIRYLAVISIVAWRVFWLTLVSRTSPKASVNAVLSDEEWKILFILFNPNRKIPKKPPDLVNVVTWIAQLGGFMARKGDRHPGITHIWRGLGRLSDLANGMALCG
ncbi:MAG: IS4 family transposase, partial [Gammaproteobacteria bacterium]|nr:IS4 family transposase [Gammaproteobacteria bacterium]